MVAYKCLKCNKVFKQKIDYTRHVNRINTCIKEEVNMMDVSLQNTSQISHKILHVEKENYMCFYCKNEFVNKYNRDRHVNMYCKIKKQHEMDKEDKYNELIERIDNNEKIFGEKIKNNEEEIKKLKNLLDKEKEKNQKLNQIINKQTNNVVGDQTNIDGDQNNITFNLIAFGREDMDKIDSKYILAALKRGISSVPVITENIHFNSKYPEFNNVYISNMNQKYAMVYNGNEWILKDKNEIIDDIYETKYDFLDEKFEEVYEQLSKSQQDSFRRFLNIHEKAETDKESLKFIKKIKQEIKMLLYNKKNIPLGRELTKSTTLPMSD